ncbi:MAG: hypothetical protein ACYTXT_36865 [Nostoc sp.]
MNPARPGFGIYIDINTNTRFTGTPIYVTSLACKANCWTATGEQQFLCLPNTIRVYVRYVDW